MIDRQAIQKLEKLCNACELSNVQQKAVSWCSVCQEALCSVCENCHRKFKMSSKHKILTLQEVQEGQKTAVSGLVTCDTHSDKYVEIFCVDHSKPCCTVCATVKHRKCETVVVIEEAAVGMRESEKMAEFIELVMQWENMLEKSMQDTEENVASVALLENNIFSEIEKLRREIIENVNKLENATKEELTTKKKVIITELTDRLSEITSLKSTVNNWHKILSTCKTDGSDIQCLIEFNKLIPMKEKIESEIEKVTSAFDERSFLFERNRLVGDFQETVKSLGEIRVVNQQQTVKLESISDSTIDAITKTDNEKVKSQSEISMFNLRQRHLNKPPNSSTDYLVRRLRSGNSSYR
ncbi:uncharacterized protein LOC143051046 [Mytilus galloprovincialis]|uniref:uncharacterized protein LOC143051046 n=1 Tax=Mytilus galloprovincialis TaxID=29158 RepID=UPI003F7B733F